MHQTSFIGFIVVFSSSFLGCHVMFTLVWSASSCVAGLYTLVWFWESECRLVILVESFLHAAELKQGQNRSVCTLDKQFLISDDARCFQHCIAPG